MVGDRGLESEAKELELENTINIGFSIFKIEVF